MMCIICTFTHLTCHLTCHLTYNFISIVYNTSFYEYNEHALNLSCMHAHWLQIWIPICRQEPRKRIACITSCQTIKRYDSFYSRIHYENLFIIIILNVGMMWGALGGASWMKTWITWLSTWKARICIVLWFTSLFFIFIGSSTSINWQRWWGWKLGCKCIIKRISTTPYFGYNIKYIMSPFIGHFTSFRGYK